MTFALLPSWLGWTVIVGAAAAALAVFLVRPRMARMAVSSLVIWARVLDERRDRSPWERIRWIVSLVLTVGIGVAMATAIVEPMRLGSTSGRVLVVLDSSWTMRAARDDGARWDHAVREAWSIARSSGGEVAIATTAEGVVEGPTRDLTRVRHALAALTPTGGEEGSWPRLAGASAVHFITDGATPRAPEADVTLHSVFTPASNVAVTAFDVEPAGAEDVRVFFAVANHARADAAVDVAVTRAADVVFKRSVPIAAGAVHRDSLRLPREGDPRFHIRIAAPDDALSIDDEAAAWLWQASPLSVGVVGPQGPLEALLAGDPALRVSAVAEAQYPTAAADVWIFNGWLPQEAPSKPALVIAPPEAPWMAVEDANDSASTWAHIEGHPLVQGVDASLVRIDAVRTVVKSGLRALAVSEAGIPLLSTDETGARLVVIPFSLQDSNIASTPAFPVLVGNAIDWLARPDRRGRRPGPVTLSADTKRVIAPGGETLPLGKFDGRTVVTLERPGLYFAESTGSARVIAVTLGDARRSNLLVSRMDPDRTPDVGPASAVWPWSVFAGWAALVALVVEWFTWRRRITV